MPQTPEAVESIEDVISLLEIIIVESQTHNDPLGYFAALYQKVTIKVKEGIEAGFFDDGERMEKLDVIFAKRYLDAYFNYKNNLGTTSAWAKVFNLSTHYWPIVLQHLLIGMNAHINLDLGIAAAEISTQGTIADLKEDFKKINTILSSLVHEVQDDLAKVWPTLKWILTKTKKVDDFLVDFSMELARDGAWKFACELASKTGNDREVMIKSRDHIVSKKAKLVTNPGMIPKVLLWMIRIGEKGTVSKKIDDLKD
jgi:hypothetical protein